MDLRAGFAKIRTEAGLPLDFPAAALAEAGRKPAAGQRADLRDVPLRSIDPAGSRDLDQALYLERSGTGYRVTYAIADVAAFVTPGGALDAEAGRRALTVYCPDERVPLHPFELCEAAASLLPGRDRPAVVWRIDLDDAGAVTGYALERALVRSRAQHTYDEVQFSLDQASAPSDEAAQQWQLLREVGEARIAQERARGGVSLSLPEQQITSDDGAWQIRFRASAPAESYNAQISLLTGMVAAQIMLDGHCGVLRTMPPAEPERLERLRLRATGLGIEWPPEASYGDVLAGLDRSSAASAAFLNAAASLFRGAAWTAFEGAPPKQTVHAAIAAPYAHVTAPLRRLVDRYGTETCLALSAGRPVPEWVSEALETIGESMAAGARRDGQVDRACTELVEAAVLQGRIGQSFDAIAISEKSIQIPDPAVVASCAPAAGDALPLGTWLRAILEVADLEGPSVAFRQLP